MIGSQTEGLRRVQQDLQEALRGFDEYTEEALTMMLQAISASTAPYVPVDTSLDDILEHFANRAAGA